MLPPIVEGAHGDVASVAVSLAYPIGDILLLIFTIGALGMTGWRPGRVWLLIAASMLLTAIADSVYVYETATGTYTPDTWLESLWPAAAVLLAIAAWAPWPRLERKRIEDWRLVLVPAVSLMAALGVFVYGNLHRQLTLPALILAIATVLAVCARLMLTVRENLAMLVGSRRLALTDPLTGLSNRRQLMEDLQLACRTAKPGAPWRLVMYDLNGFKRYNDTYGHPAGDALLTRLSDKLSAIVAAHGTAYRMGGDEFCVLLEAPPATDRRARGRERRRPIRARAGLYDRRRARRGEHPGRGMQTRPRSCASPTSACTSARIIKRAGSPPRVPDLHRRSVDAEHGELALAPRQRHRDAVIPAARELARDRREPAAGRRGRCVVGADRYGPSVLAAVLGAYAHRPTEADHPARGGGFLDDDRRGDLLAHARNLRLQVRLLVLGVVVLAVLLQVPPLARGFDPLRDLSAALSLELLQLGVQAL